MSLLRPKLCTLRRVFVFLVVCLSVYMYLYTNTVQDVRSSPLYHRIKDDLQAVWKENRAANRPIPTQTIKFANFTDEYKYKIEQNETIPLLTLFTSWTDKAEKYLVHNLTTVNWLSLRPYIIPVIFTNDKYLAHVCSKHGWKVLPVRVAAADGVPVLKYMFTDVMKVYNSTFYGYANGDILFTNQLIETLILIANKTDLNRPIMLSGRRTNVENVTKDEGSNFENITRISQKRGTLFNANAEDYFITQRTYPWKNLPEVVIGRRAYDNWLIYNARKSSYAVIDISETCLAVHLTTASGNHEGHGADNTHYNYNLLKKMFKTINYLAGSLNCVTNHTVYDDKKAITLHSSIVGKQCVV